MRTIEVDFDVYKAITSRRPTEDVTENEVLRNLLGLSTRRGPAVATTVSGPDASDWVSKGVRFPAGTEFRANYKGQTWLGRVERGALVVNGQRFDTPSAAAVAITKSPTNGWTFWECRLPGQSSWQILKGLRRK
jgi:Restriction Enzyme Adenine Methylase Associated